MTTLPRHLTGDPGKIFLLRRWANGVAGLYGEPVYLCGSALRDDNPSPRDWDVRLRMSHADFAARYGDPDVWDVEGATGKWTDVRWRWAADNVKQTRRAWRHTRANVDFQVYPAGHWDSVYGDKPRARLDTAPEPPAENRQTVAGVALGLVTLQRAASKAPVGGGHGTLYIGDETARPELIGEQAVATLAELGWDWDDRLGCWVALTA